jgi:hypothetical protein
MLIRIIVARLAVARASQAGFARRRAPYWGERRGRSETWVPLAVPSKKRVAPHHVSDSGPACGRDETIGVCQGSRRERRSSCLRLVARPCRAGSSRSSSLQPVRLQTVRLNRLVQVRFRLSGPAPRPNSKKSHPNFAYNGTESGPRNIPTLANFATDWATKIGPNGL